VKLIRQLGLRGGTIDPGFFGDGIIPVFSHSIPPASGAINGWSSFLRAPPRSLACNPTSRFDPMHPPRRNDRPVHSAKLEHGFWYGECRLAILWAVLSTSKLRFRFDQEVGPCRFPSG
jgi:hypothetical protein